MGISNFFLHTLSLVCHLIGGFHYIFIRWAGIFLLDGLVNVELSREISIIQKQFLLNNLKVNIKKVYSLGVFFTFEFEKTFGRGQRVQ